MFAGEEPLTSQATHALGLILNKLIKGVNCSIGAEAPNVKDEPRGVRHQPFFPNDKAGSSVEAPTEIAGPVPALALAPC